MPPRQKIIPEAAVIACHKHRICLVTTSSGKRWVVPKGRIKKGAHARDTAAEEAWEEAGIVGRATGRPLGHYSFRKAGQEFRVAVYWMDVEKVKNDWPERNCRQRRWLSFEKAVAMIEQSPLRKIVRRAVGA